MCVCVCVCERERERRLRGITQTLSISFDSATLPSSRLVSSRLLFFVVMNMNAKGLLSMACAYGEVNLVLGAFGCGVFGNDARLVAALFGELLGTKYQHRFRKVVFATLDDANSKAFASLAPPAKQEQRREGGTKSKMDSTKS